jgi:hypothetical protein
VVAHGADEGGQGTGAGVADQLEGRVDAQRRLEDGDALGGGAHPRAPGDGRDDRHLVAGRERRAVVGELLVDRPAHLVEATLERRVHPFEVRAEPGDGEAVRHLDRLFVETPELTDGGEVEEAKAHGAAVSSQGGRGANGSP